MIRNDLKSFQEKRKFVNAIKASWCFWRESLANDIPLQTSPTVGETYLVTFRRSFTFSLSERMWLFYDCPVAVYDGYENEGEIEQARFCYGQITELVETKKSKPTVKFKVEKTLSFEEIIKQTSLTELPLYWRESFQTILEIDHYWIQKLGNYYSLTMNGGSTTQEYHLDAVFVEQNGEYCICLIHEWNPGLNEYFGINCKITESIKNKIFREKI